MKTRMLSTLHFILLQGNCLLRCVLPKMRSNIAILDSNHFLWKSDYWKLIRLDLENRTFVIILSTTYFAIGFTAMRSIANCLLKRPSHNIKILNHYTMPKVLCNPYNNNSHLEMGFHNWGSTPYLWCTTNKI